MHSPIGVFWGAGVVERRPLRPPDFRERSAAEGGRRSTIYGKRLSHTPFPCVNSRSKR
jgi:hypothetical protein